MRAGPAGPWWLHGCGTADVDAALLSTVVRGLTFPAGRMHVFVHGEGEEVRQIRRHLLAERNVSRADLSCSPFWRRHFTNEAWRRIKSQWIADVERDIA